MISLQEMADIKSKKGKCIHNEATLFLSGNLKIAIKKQRMKKRESVCVCFRESQRERERLMDGQTDRWTDI